ncbi:MAG: hypothetical protein KY464_12565 [Gemmatimonadetes bacterium]|nr:hypothetical protein [Gemmatimonadota bacterium]
MPDSKPSFRGLRSEHPIFFWGTTLVIVFLLGAAAMVAIRVPQYRSEAAEIDRRMSEEERATRDQLLQARTQRTELGIALLQRELRLKALEEKRLHLAISMEDSTLYLRHGPATLRQVRVQIGGDSVINAPSGQSWRFVSALGERHVADKDVGGTYTIPEWVYLSRGQPVPSEGERRIEGGLGRYVLRLDDGTEIYTRPREGPFAEGVKPASFVVEGESDLRAIFDAIGKDTPVYIY